MRLTFALLYFEETYEFVRITLLRPLKVFVQDQTGRLHFAGQSVPARESI